MFELFQDKENFFIVSELMDVGALWKHIPTRRYFNDRRVAIIIKQLLYALKFLHEQNIVHRDLKSPNVLMERLPEACKDDSQIVAKLADFGLATFVDPTSKGLKGVVGTDIYMAPEIVR